MLDSSIGVSQRKIEEFFTYCRVCWLQPFDLLCYCYIYIEALGNLELTLKFPFPCTSAEEVIHIYQSPAKLSIDSTANSLVGWVGDFAWEHRHVVWQWLVLFFLTLDKTKRPLIGFQNYIHCLLQKYKLLRLFILSALLLLKLEFECT